MKIRMVSFLCILIAMCFLFYGCKCGDTEEKTQQIHATQAITPKEDTSNQYYAGDKVIVKVQTPSGEKIYEGTMVRWWDHGVTIKVESDRTLLAIAAEVYTVEKSITR